MKLSDLWQRRERLWVLGRRQVRRGMLVFVVAVGALCGVTAVIFHAALLLAHDLLIGAVNVLPPGTTHALAIVAVPMIAAILLGILVPRFSPDANGGLALVRAAYTDNVNRLTLRGWLGTFCATPLSLGSGAPLGPEGPTVVLTSGIAVGLSRLLRLPRRVLRGMVPVGTAAGIAAIFNTPITGVVFALEEVIGTASRGVLGSAIVAAVAAAVVEKSALGGRPLLPAKPAAWHGAQEMLGFALLGFAAGATSGYLPRAVPVVRGWLTRLSGSSARRAHAIRAGAAGFSIGVMGLLSPDILGFGYTPIARWLAGEGDAASAGIAFLLKAVAVIVALAAPLIGGVFAPTLFLGASFGAFIGHLLSSFSPFGTVHPGAYALVGMGAFFGGFMRTPIASVLIVFELTGDYALVVPQMLAVAISILVARRISESTHVELHLEAQGISSESGGDPLALRRVTNVMTVPADIVNVADSLEDVMQLDEDRRRSIYPVVDEAGDCIGMLESDAIRMLPPEAVESVGVSDLMRPVRVLTTPSETLDRLALRLGAAGETRCPVVDSETSLRIIGFVAVADLLKARVRAAIEDAESTFE